ncbi:RtcB family protein [Babesia caballi]|uniref:RtcB family protein n=1 Tax=Babesia caballi TaxID=5871 RepID=A0AAV4LQA1_BABCB|nr:RtcB family protein [Babesia caballi]
MSVFPGPNEDESMGAHSSFSTSAGSSGCAFPVALLGAVGLLSPAGVAISSICGSSRAALVAALGGLTGCGTRSVAGLAWDVCSFGEALFSAASFLPTSDCASPVALLGASESLAAGAGGAFSPSTISELVVTVNWGEDELLSAAVVIDAGVSEGSLDSTGACNRSAAAVGASSTLAASSQLPPSGAMRACLCFARYLFATFSAFSHSSLTGSPKKAPMRSMRSWTASLMCPSAMDTHMRAAIMASLGVFRASVL